MQRIKYKFINQIRSSNPCHVMSAGYTLEDRLIHLVINPLVICTWNMTFGFLTSYQLSAYVIG